MSTDKIFEASMAETHELARRNHTDCAYANHGEVLSLRGWGLLAVMVKLALRRIEERLDAQAGGGLDGPGPDEGLALREQLPP